MEASFFWTSPGAAFETTDFFRATATFDAGGSPIEFVNVTGEGLDGQNVYTFASVAIPDAATTFSLVIEGQTSNNIDEFIHVDNFVVTGISAVIPEPSAFALSCLGLLGLVGFRRRYKH